MNPYFESDAAGIRLYCAPCEQVLPSLPKFDLLLTDPPYGIGVGKMGMGKGKKKTSFEGFAWDSTPPAISLLMDLVALSRFQIIWGGNYFALPPSACWLAWDKVQQFSGADFELAWTNLDGPSKAYRLSRVEAYGSVERLHPTQKPIGLFLWCLGFAPDVQTIIDPFSGSGTTLLAAIKTGRHATGIEREEKYCEIAARRIEKELAQGRLFEPQPPKPQATQIPLTL